MAAEELNTADLIKGEAGKSLFIDIMEGKLGS